MAQQSLDGSNPHRTCGECMWKEKHTLYGSKTRSFYKCPKKPRGWGYDITLKHVACKNFKELA